MPYSHFATLRNLNDKLRAIISACWNVLDFAGCQHPVDDPAKDDVFAVQEVALCCRDEELTPIRIWP